MAVRVLVLVVAAVVTLVAAGGAELNEGSGLRKPVCADMADLQACPLLYLPICGTDGNTYANECQLCVEQIFLLQHLRATFKLNKFQVLVAPGVRVIFETVAGLSPTRATVLVCISSLWGSLGSFIFHFYHMVHNSLFTKYS
ncbi:hypothetical protein BTVI_130167 [Pitangus sulphuratus]|nr:hypothetical protein BTVI_130167 [Pitangus sulphuratus]